MPFKYNPFTNNFDEVIPANSGDVVGPGSSTDNAIVRWDGTTGQILQNSGAILDDAGTLHLIEGNIGTGNFNHVTADDVITTDLILTNPLDLAYGGTNSTNAVDARSNLGLGSMSVQNSSSVSITGGTITGITDLSVLNGGTGRSSATEYAVICGGTNSTAQQQSIDSVGTSGQVLTSNGASALPTFQDAAGGGVQAPSFAITEGTYYNPSQIFYAVTTSFGPTDSLLYLTPFFLPRDITLSRIGIRCQTAVAGSTVRLGLYSMNQDTGALTLVVDGGTVSSAANGILTVTVSTPLTVGTAYFFATVFNKNAGSPTFWGLATPMILYLDASAFRTYFTVAAVSAGDPFVSSYTLASLTAASSTSPAIVYR